MPARGPKRHGIPAGSTPMIRRTRARCLNKSPRPARPLGPYSLWDLPGTVDRLGDRLYAVNARFDLVLCSATRRDGYEQVGRTIQHGKDNLGGAVYNYGSNNKIVAAINNADDSAACVRYLDTNNWWSDIITNAAPDTRFNFLVHLDELYVAALEILEREHVAISQGKIMKDDGGTPILDDGPRLAAIREMRPHLPARAFASNSAGLSRTLTM